MIAPENLFEQRLLEERRNVDLELLRREHRFINSTLALIHNWNSGKEYKSASIEGFLRCLFALIFKTGVGASVTGIGLVGVFLAYQANRLLQEQTIRINIQSHLKEAQRRSTLIYELGQIMEDVSKEKANPAKPNSSMDEYYRVSLVNLANNKELQDPLILEYVKSQYTPSRSLVGRIAALSTSLKPYYYISYARKIDTLNNKSSTLFSTVIDKITEITLPSGNDYYPLLIDEPVSPERGQLLLYMLSSGVNLLPAGNAGATFEGADLQESEIYGFFLPTINLRNAKFQNAVFSTVRFGLTDPSLGVQLEGADFTCAAFLNTVFSSSIIKDAKFSFVRMRNFNLTHLQDNRNSYSFPFTDLSLADFTDADFSDAVITREVFPWAFDKLRPQDSSAEPPSLRGFDRNEWHLESIPLSNSPALAYKMTRKNGALTEQYETRRKRVCTRNDRPNRSPRSRTFSGVAGN